MKPLPVLAAVILVGFGGALPAGPVESRPIDDYALELVISPVSRSPVVKKLGAINLTVYPQGVQARSRWLDGYLRRGSSNVRLFDSKTRLYSDVPLTGFRSIILKIAGRKGDMVPAIRSYSIGDPERGRVGTIPADRYRVHSNDHTWIDVWTTDSIAESPILRRLSREVLAAISDELGALPDQIPGTPLYVEINTPRHPKTPVLTTRTLRRSSAGHQRDLSLGGFYLRAPMADRLWR